MQQMNKAPVTEFVIYGGHQRDPFVHTFFAGFKRWVGALNKMNFILDHIVLFSFEFS